MLYFDIEKDVNLSKELLDQTKGKNQYPLDIKLENICFLETSPSRFRLVTHHGILMEDVEKTLIALKKMII